MSKILIFIDQAHGVEVPGKRSPDNTHYEYKWSRAVGSMLCQALKVEGIGCVFTHNGMNEPGLSNRARFVTTYKAPNQTKLMVSLHNNAAGSGATWMKARGFEVWTTVGETTSDKYARVIMKQLVSDFPELKARYESADLDKEANFTVLCGNGYSAVLIEWLFQDNQEDVKLLKDENINKRFIDSLVVAIKSINNTL